MLSRSLAWLRRPAPSRALAAIHRLVRWRPAGPGDAARRAALRAYQATLDARTAAHARRPLLETIRAHNHRMVEALDRFRPVRGCVVLDVGASPHGFGLERAVELGAAGYVGVSLAVHTWSRGAVPGAYLLRMDAMQLGFADVAFDCALSVDTFEHVADPERVLAELARVLKPGGRALITFNPIWSSAQGHHLVHFGDLGSLVPPWTHLVLTPEEARRMLADRWTADLPLSLDDAVDYAYRSPAINRRDVRYFEAIFARAPLEVIRRVRLADRDADPATVRDVAARTGYSPSELTTRGMSVFLRKPLAPRPAPSIRAPGQGETAVPDATW